jgi:hypothetical protein
VSGDFTDAGDGTIHSALEVPYMYDGNYETSCDFADCPGERMFIVRRGESELWGGGRSKNLVE